MPKRFCFLFFLFFCFLFLSQLYFSSPCDIVKSQSRVNRSVSLIVCWMGCCRPLHPAAEVINVGIYLSKWSPGRGEGLQRQLSRGWRAKSTPVFCPSLLLIMRISMGFPSGLALHDGKCFLHLCWCPGFQFVVCGKMGPCFKKSKQKQNKKKSHFPWHDLVYLSVWWEIHNSTFSMFL